jgi:uncharacterized RDD family membrane protein YckC
MSSDAQPIDTTVDIVTPENIAFHYQVAGPFRRFPAYLIDVLIRVFVLVVLAILARLLSIGLGAVSMAIWILAEFVLSWFYGGLFETYWNGQTPGKRILGIRVLSANGRPLNGYQAILRNIMRTVDLGPMISGEILGLPPVPLIPTFALGLAVMAVNRRFQRLGDVVCKTMVVVEDRPWLAGVAKIEDPRAFQLASYLPADLQVSRSMARALAHYAERRQYFSPPRRREVAKHVAQPLLEQFGLPDNTSYDLLLCAMYYRLFIADRGDDETHAARAQAAMAGASPFLMAAPSDLAPDAPQPISPRGGP